MSDDFRAALGSGVGIGTAQMVGFTVAPDPFVVAVALVRGDHDHGPHRRAGPHGFQHVHGAEHIGLKGACGVLVGFAHQGLGRQVEDHLGLETPHGVDHALPVADVAAQIFQVRVQMHGREM